MIYKIWYWLNNIPFWLDQNLPAPCDRCRRWVRKSDLILVRTTTGAIANLCPRCHNELYCPRRETK